MKKKETKTWKPSPRFIRALAFATKSHQTQRRKGTAIPYISHPLQVAGLVMEAGGSEDQAIAALLHDTIEDCGVTARELTRRFGKTVARIVADCSHDVPESSGTYRERKGPYVAHIRTAKGDALLVSIADKLHNLRSILRDVDHFGAGVWRRFSGEKKDVIWYYRELLRAYESRSEELGDGYRMLLNDYRKSLKGLK